MASTKPVFVIAPPGGLSPAFYGMLLHLLMKAGYGASSSNPPSNGPRAGDKVSMDDDVAFLRDRLVIPLLDVEERNVIMVGHSNSSMTASTAVAGLGKSARTAAGKKTSVIGQIHVASLLPKGGDGKSMIDAMGGSIPPHLRADEAANLIRCDDFVTPFLSGVEKTLASGAALSTLSPSLTWFQTPIPRASWDEAPFQGRIGYVKTTEDDVLPPAMQDAVIQASGCQWVKRDIPSSHAPNMSKPEELAQILVEMAQHFESLES